MSRSTATRPSPCAIVLAALAALVSLAPAAVAAAETVPNPDPATISVWEPCQPGVGVTVIVDFGNLGDQDVWVKCAPSGGINGVQVLIDAGLAPVGTAQYGLGFICRIAGVPTAEEEDCQQTPPIPQYWSYWHAQPGGQWSYSAYGAGAWTAGHGTVEGWSMSNRPPAWGLAPRVFPMDARGDLFTLPAVQPSSAKAARRGAEWLVERTTWLANGRRQPAQILDNAIALDRHDAGSVDIPQIAAMLERAGAVDDLIGQGTYGTPSYRIYPDRVARLIRALPTIGRDPRAFLGRDFVAELVARLDPGGRVLAPSGQPGSLGHQAATVLALSDAEALPANAVTTLLQQVEDYSAPLDAELAATLIEALDASRAIGADGIDDAIADLADALADLRDGSDFRSTPGGLPSATATLAAARGLGIAGDAELAELATRRASQFQVTPQLASDGPAAEDVGAFLNGEPGLRQGLRYGVDDSTLADQLTAPGVLAMLQNPYRDPAPATVATGSALEVGPETALLTGSVDPGTANQQVTIELRAGLAAPTVLAGPAVEADADPALVEIRAEDLSPATTYSYRVVATDTGGTVVRGEPSVFTTAAAPPRAGPDPKPSPTLVDPPAITPPLPTAAKLTLPKAAARLAVVRRRGVLALRCVTAATAACEVSIAIPAHRARRLGLKLRRGQSLLTVGRATGKARGRLKKLGVRLDRRFLRSLEAVRGSVPIVARLRVSAPGRPPVERVVRFRLR